VHLKSELTLSILTFRIGAWADFIDWLEIHQDPGSASVALQAQQFAVERNFFAAFNLVAGFDLLTFRYAL